MTTKEWLNRGRNIDIEINALLEERDMVLNGTTIHLDLAPCKDESGCI